MEVMEASYSVVLCDYPAMPDADRAKAEARYARVLERQFGGPAQVAEALAIVQSLEDTPPEEITAHAKAVFKQWGKASAAANEAGFQGIGDAEGCYFEVRLA